MPEASTVSEAAWLSPVTSISTVQFVPAAMVPRCTFDFVAQ